MATYDIRPLQLRILKNLLAIDKVCKEHNLRPVGGINLVHT